MKKVGQVEINSKTLTYDQVLNYAENILQTRRALYCANCGGIAQDFSHRCQKQSFEQGSTSWLAWRMGGIGASDAPAVMGESPWMTAMQLWELKTGRRKPEPSNYQMRRGRALEDMAREKYSEMVGITVDKMCAEHQEFNFLRASLDGANKENGKVVEIKCPGKKDHEKALSGQIPRKYLWQLVHILAVTGLDKIDYFSFDGREGVILTFHRDEKLEEQLLTTLKKFWDCVIRDVPPKADKIEGRVEIFKVRKFR
jgi:putative phage-type endonuclease